MQSDHHKTTTTATYAESKALAGWITGTHVSIDTIGNLSQLMTFGKVVTSSSSQNKDIIHQIKTS
jgi:hypothetical protein